MITYKWDVWRRMLHVELACYLVWVLAFQAFVLIFQARCWTLHPRLQPLSL